MIAEALVRIGAAVFVGFIIGFFSWAKSIRVFILIALGSALVTITSVEFFRLLDLPLIADPGRLAAQIITALGFLGTGLIWMAEKSERKSLPVAASLWVTAILGMAIGIAQAAIAAAIVFMVLLFYILSNLGLQRRKM